MGLHADITQDIANAFDGELADAVKIASLVYLSSSYDVGTGEVSEIDTKVSTRGVIQPIDESMIDDEAVLRGDVAILILQDELTTKPKIDDFIASGLNRYHIYNITADPADVQWTMLGREI